MRHRLIFNIQISYLHFVSMLFIRYKETSNLKSLTLITHHKHLRLNSFLRITIFPDNNRKKIRHLVTSRMNNPFLLLNFSNNPNLSLCQRTLTIISTRYYHPYFLKPQILSNHFYVVSSCLAIQDIKLLRIAILMRFINCFNNCSYSIIKVRIFCKVSI